MTSSACSLPTPRSCSLGPASGFQTMDKLWTAQGWGWHVATLAYGDAQGGRSENSWYTLRFSGTSSASPIVAGAVACLQGFAGAALAGLTPLEVRDILRRPAGTPQTDDAPLPRLLSTSARCRTWPLP